MIPLKHEVLELNIAALEIRGVEMMKVVPYIRQNKQNINVLVNNLL